APDHEIHLLDQFPLFHQDSVGREDHVPRVFPDDLKFITGEGNVILLGKGADLIKMFSVNHIACHIWDQRNNTTIYQNCPTRPIPDVCQFDHPNNSTNFEIYQRTELWKSNQCSLRTGMFLLDRNSAKRSCRWIILLYFMKPAMVRKRYDISIVYSLRLYSSMLHYPD